MTESLHQPQLFADITAKPGMGALFVKLVGPSIATRETPIIQGMITPAIADFGPTLKHVVLDMTAVTYINSGGLGMLVAARSQAAKSGNAKVILLGPSVDLQNLLKMVKFDKLFAIAKNAEELAKAMGR